MDAGRQADRPDPPARGVRQHLLRRPQAQPLVHGREPVALRRIYRNTRRSTGLTGSAIDMRRRRDPPAPLYVFGFILATQTVAKPDPRHNGTQNGTRIGSAPQSLCPGRTEGWLY